MHQDSEAYSALKRYDSRQGTFDVIFWLQLQSGFDRCFFSLSVRPFRHSHRKLTRSLELTVDAYPVKPAERFIEFDRSVPLTDSLKGLIVENFAQSRKDGYSYPACIYCPAV